MPLDQGIAVGLLIPPSNPTFQLVKLRQPEVLRAINKESVRSRHIQTRFQNICGQKEIQLLVEKLPHDRLHFQTRSPFHEERPTRNSGRMSSIFLRTSLRL